MFFIVKKVTLINYQNHVLEIQLGQSEVLELYLYSITRQVLLERKWWKRNWKSDREHQIMGSWDSGVEYKQEVRSE